MHDKKVTCLSKNCYSIKMLQLTKNCNFTVMALKVDTAKSKWFSIIEVKFMVKIKKYYII